MDYASCLRSGGGGGGGGGGWHPRPAPALGKYLPTVLKGGGDPQRLLASRVHLRGNLTGCIIPRSVSR